MPRASFAHRLHTPAFERKEADGSVTPLEKKRVGRPVSVQSNGEEGTFEGYGAVFNTEHPTSSWMLGPEWKDVIRPGAFSKSLAEHKKIGSTPSLLYMHERGYIAGAWQSLAEDKDGLHGKGLVSKSAIAPSGVPIYELMKMGALTGLSIGFQVQKHALDEENKLREILAVDLSEVSIVDIPGGPLARITDVKSGDHRNPQFLEAVLRDAGLSRKEAKALLAKGFTALRDVAADDEPTRRDADRNAGSSRSLADLLRGYSAIYHPIGAPCPKSRRTK